MTQFFLIDGPAQRDSLIIPVTLLKLYGRDIATLELVYGAPRTHEVPHKACCD